MGNFLAVKVFLSILAKPQVYRFRQKLELAAGSWVKSSGL
jgi:hypothetical protein